MPNVIRRVLLKGAGRQKSIRAMLYEKYSEGHLLSTDGKEPCAKECYCIPPEAGKGKEMNCPLELLGKTQLCQHLDFSQMKPILNF